MPRRHILLLVIIIVYLSLGALFAVKTPAWQAPDEPAHYNYVRFVATTGGFPALMMGDYPHGYLEEIKNRKFPSDMSIDPIRYEFHQPPLYYLLLSPVFALTSGALLPLRLATVLLGAGIVLLAYAIGRRVYPQSASLALGTAAFVAFLPQHLAGVAQVGNDALAELLFAALLWLLVGWVTSAGSGGQRSGVRSQESGGKRQEAGGRQQRSAAFGCILLGCLLGLILITKTTAYIAVPLAGGVLLWRWWYERASLRTVIAQALLVIAPAALIALPWYARNIAIYGWPDFLGLIRHDQIVVGQMRTGEFLAKVGWDAYMQRTVEFTFKSFWGVFGWLGVFMDSRVYFVLALLSGVAVAGGVSRIAYRVLHGHTSDGAHDEPVSAHSPAATRHSPSAIRLLALSALLTLLAYAWYNTQFVQHQGRYLFTALIPIGLAVAAGWEAAVALRGSRIVAVALAVFAALLAIWGVTSRTGLPKQPLALTLVFAGGLFVIPWLPRRFQPLLEPLLRAAPYLVIALIAIYAVFAALVPQLRVP